MSGCKGFSVILLGVYLMFTVTFSVTIGMPSNEQSICLKTQSHSSKTCYQESKISCSDTQRIRILNITYYKSMATRTSCTTGCSGAKQILDVTDEDSRTLNLFVHQKCSYRTSCQLADSIHTPQGIGEKIWFIDVRYSCISYDDVMDFCKSDEETVTDELHIVTDINIANATCGCVVSENAKIVITEYRPYYEGICSQTDIYIDGEKPFDCGDRCENVVFSNIPRNNIDRKKYVTISETGKGNATVVCKKKDTNTVSMTTLNQESSSRANAGKPTASPQNNPTIPGPLSSSLVPESGKQAHEEKEDSHISTIPVVGVVVGSTVAFAAMIAAFIVYIKYTRRRKTVEQPKNEEPYYHSPQFNTDSSQMVPSQTERSNYAHEMQKGITAGAGGMSQANGEDGNASNEVDEYAVIKQTDDAVYSSDHYAKILDDCHKQRIANATVRYSKAGHYDILQSNNPPTTTQYKDNESEYDVTSTNCRPKRNPVTVETLRYPDIYSHINQTDNVSMAERVENYSHINVAQSSENYSKIERVGNHQETQCQDNYSHLILSPSTNGPTAVLSTDLYNHLTATPASGDTGMMSLYNEFISAAHVLADESWIHNRIPQSD